MKTKSTERGVHAASPFKLQAGRLFQTLGTYGSRSGLKPALLLVVVAVLSGFTASAKTFNVLDFGAKGDGETLDTAAIQRTIDAAAGEGGKVLIPSRRTFLVSP